MMELFSFLKRRTESAVEPMRYAERARLFEYRKSYIVCSQNDLWETQSLTVMDGSVDDDELGRTIIKHLEEYEAQVTAPPAQKLTEWAAFKASGTRSVKAFERELWEVQLNSMNSAVLVEARPRLSLDECCLGAHATANRIRPERVGAAVRKALRAAKVLREQGVV